MIIGACGYGATGSSVLTDLLREYDDVQVFDNFEFTCSYKVDGLEDLEYHLMKQYAKGESGDYAIKRFLDASHCFETPFINKPCSGKKYYRLSEEFISKLIQIKYKGVLSADLMLSKNILRNVLAFASKKILMPKIITRITRKQSYIWPCRDIYYSIEPQNFYQEAKVYTTNIIQAMGADMSKPICLDQPFEGNCPEQSFPFFEDPYAIVIDRDPRDLYLAGKYTKDPNFKFAPKNDVKKFVIYYRNMRKHYKENPRVLRICFEDMVYKYDDSIRLIEEFLKLGEHKRPKSLFDPSRSINNTQLIRLHPNDKGEIEYIEKELKNFLYPFEKFNSVKFSGRPFDGAGRKVFEQ